MKRKNKKKEQQIQALMNLTILGFAIVGWYTTKSLAGVVTVVILGLLMFLFFTLWKNARERERLRRSGIHEIDSMDGVQFEYYLKELFRSRGYSVEMTKTTGDFGADLVLKKEPKKIVVQAKRYSNSVGLKAVQEVISSIKMYDATEAWVITNSHFTKAAKELAEKNDVKMIGREQLVNMINELNPSQNPNPVQIKREIKHETHIKCEKCGSEMLIRKGPKGIFYGCASYPKCRHTKKAV